MNKRVLAVLTGIVMICVAGVSTAAGSQCAGSFFDTVVQGQWLTASDEDTQGENTDTPPEEEEEPDCE